MSLAKMPNYNLLRYEFGWIKNETPMTITTLAFLRTIHNRYNEHQFEDVFEWYNSLTDNQLLNIGVRKSFGNYYLDFVIKVSHHTESGIIITIEKSVNGDIIKYASQSFLGGEEDE